MNDRAADEEVKNRRALPKRKLFDAVFMLGFLCCLIPGPFPNLTGAASAALLICVAVSFFDENFFLYMALFMYLRYRLLIGGTPAYRVYSYLLALRFLIDLPKIKFKAAYIFAITVFILHSVFATAAFTGLRMGLNVIVDCGMVYVFVCRVFPDKRLMRKFIFAFLLGGIASGIYGRTNDAFTKEINIRGAGARKVSRSFGALSDSNFAGLFYTLCVMCTIAIKGTPKWLKAVFLAFFGVMLLQTASLSALITFAGLLIFYVILKYRGKSLFILTLVFAGAAVLSATLSAIPQLWRIDAVAGLLIRINEKLAYVTMGRLDLLTTGRSSIWETAASIFEGKSFWGKMIGGSVITTAYIEESLMIACHNTYLQGLLNFGALGSLLIFIPFFAVFFYRFTRHLLTEPGDEYEDMRIIQLIFTFSFLFFGMTVDFFIDWAYMFLYFI